MRMSRRAGLLVNPELEVMYTGTYTQNEVTMDGMPYLLLELTSDGTLTANKAVIGDIWFCGAGGNGMGGGQTPSGVNGGGGAYARELDNVIFSRLVVNIGQPSSDFMDNGAGGNSEVTIGGITYSAYGGNRSPSGTVSYKTYVGHGGSGGGGNWRDDGSGDYGLGDGLQNKRPFNSSYFAYPFCDGGGGGTYYDRVDTTYYSGGAGGTNGGDGSRASTGTASDITAGAGGGHYGGTGGMKRTTGGGTLPTAATGYGSGGGGGAFYWYSSTSRYNTIQDGASGYQGVCFVRIPIL